MFIGILTKSLDKKRLNRVSESCLIKISPNLSEKLKRHLFDCDSKLKRHLFDCDSNAMIWRPETKTY